MAIERTWKQISAVPFTADGQANGIVTIQDTSCFKVNMAVVINAVGKEPLRLGVKRVIDNKMLIVGPENKSVHSKYDISAYVLGINPTIEAPEQSRPEIPPADYERAVYEEEPTVAKRVVEVDKHGDIYSLENPKPITGSISVTLGGLENPNVSNILIDLKETEKSFQLPATVKKYSFYIREGAATTKIAFINGNSNIIYKTIERGEEYSETNLKRTVPLTLYFQTDKSNVVAEIVYWT